MGMGTVAGVVGTANATSCDLGHSRGYTRHRSQAQLLSWATEDVVTTATTRDGGGHESKREGQEKERSGEEMVGRKEMGEKRGHEIKSGSGERI